MTSASSAPKPPAFVNIGMPSARPPTTMPEGNAFEDGIDDLNRRGVKTVKCSTSTVAANETENVPLFPARCDRQNRRRAARQPICSRPVRPGRRGRRRRERPLARRVDLSVRDRVERCHENEDTRILRTDGRSAARATLRRQRDPPTSDDSRQPSRRRGRQNRRGALMVRAMRLRTRSFASSASEVASTVTMGPASVRCCSGRFMEARKQNGQVARCVRVSPDRGRSKTARPAGR